MKAPVVRQKSFKLERVVPRFSKLTGRGEKYLFLYWKEKLSSVFEVWLENGVAVQSFETAISSLDFSCRKLIRTPKLRRLKTMK